MEKKFEENPKSILLIAIVIIIQVTLWVTIILDVSIARQTIGFVYLTFLPGLVIVRLMKLDRLNSAETIVFSVGLSVAFVMLIGFALNILATVTAFRDPFGVLSIGMICSTFVLTGTAICHFRSRNVARLSNVGNFQARSLLLLALPVLSIVGATYSNATGNTSILILTILLIAIVLSIAISFKRLIPTKLYEIVILAIAIALLLHVSLIGNYITGADAHSEYYVSTLTQKNGYWNSTAFFSDQIVGTYNNMLSITVLPTVYSNVLNIDITLVFKVVFPLIFSFVPLALYLFWQERLGTEIGLLAAFLVMSQATFYWEMPGLGRQMIAELFFVLLFILMFSKKISSVNILILFVVFGFSLVISHYSMAILFLFLLSLTWLVTHFARRSTPNLALSSVILFISLLFSWYIYTCSSVTFDSMVTNGNRILGGLIDFLDPASRGQAVLTGLGMTQVQSSFQIVGRIIGYATELFILLGFLALVLRKEKRNSDFQYFVLCSASMILLAMCILLPNFAASLTMERFYHILLIFLAPLFGIGCFATVKFVTKTNKKTLGVILVAILISTYFLFQTNFVYEVTGSPSWSLPLSQYRLGTRLYTISFGYVTEQEVFGVTWLSKNFDINNLTVYADRFTNAPLDSYGGVYLRRIYELTNVTNPTTGEFIYLGEANTVYGKVDFTWNTSDVLNSNPLNAVYSNGNCQIYQKP